MQKTLIHLAVLAALASMAPISRARTNDVAFTYRMGAGFPGDINRTHPFSSIAGLLDDDQPVRLYGDPALVDSAESSYRGFQAGDTAVTVMAGVLVRPYPVQQTTGGMSAALGTAAPPTAPSVVDILEDGFIMVKCNNYAAQQPAKGGIVYVWCAASAGAQVQGGFSSVASGGNTAALANAEWTGPGDANGVAEIRVWKAR